ncbi:MAG TPA: carboxymuconolactone decarboxylase family protein [Xanthomonadales bacterium]|nr:carboxymuconolactone decarboxylase family protein [Xanthomonadales bacterium]
MKVIPLPVDQWDPGLQEIARDMNGQPINVHKLMAHHPELLKAWWNFRNHSVRGGALGQRLGELVILRVAVHMKTWYEWASHVDRSLAVGLSLEEIERVKLGAGASGWTAQERWVVQAVDELVRAHAISASTLESLQQFCSLEQVFDLIAIQGMYVILAGFINSFGLELDEIVQERLPDGVSEAAFINELANS